MPTLPSKVCAACGRSFVWRKKWARDWAQVRYCSERCRTRKTPAADVELERRILDMLAARAQDATMCPSEVARAEGGPGGDGWRTRMEPVRAAARRLVARGEVEILQGGRVVDASTARGPIRLRLRRR